MIDDRVDDMLRLASEDLGNALTPVPPTFSPRRGARRLSRATATSSPAPRSPRVVRGVLVSMCGVVVLAALFALVDRGTDDSTSVATPAGEPVRADPSALLGLVDAPDADFVELARGDGWVFGASAAGGAVCEVVRATDGGSGSGCGKPTEIEALGLGFTDLKTGRLITGTTVGRAVTIVIEFRDGHTEEIPALHHPDLADYSFFVTDYSADIVGAAARSEDGIEIARASAQTLRFITESDPAFNARDADARP